ncbi:MAG: hypothetical protein U5K99_08345 [Anaerolineales bacterium]|nr:hypothetical protein [Anaerolineales bacterium]
MARSIEQRQIIHASNIPDLPFRVENLSCRGEPTTTADIPAYYPAFDITPPHLVSGIITLKGVFSPYDLINHYQKKQENV